ncbi:MAG TPA: response regulator transcription factor [Acidimicrobiales bacterium]|nr:response regulator transcription factor [Acidimicrobiales bacterium]
MPGPDNIFLREGEYWTIAFGGASFRLRDSKGLGHLATLLRSPGREFHVLELAASVGATGASRRRVGNDAVSLHAEGLRIGDFGDAGDVLDAQAKASYRRRLLELHEEAEEAKAYNDPVRTERAQAEIDALEQQLSAAFGLGGRPRKAGSAAERARVNVRNTIASAMKQIATHSPDLADHLKKSVRTGTFCWYIGDESWNREVPGGPRSTPNGSDSSGAGTVSVLIVDDHPMWRQTLRRVIEGSGAGRVVAEAADGDEAVSAALDARPDVVVMDMNLPSVDGVEATRRLLEALPEIKVMMLSSSDERHDVVAALEAGASGYLVKTAEPDQLAEAVQRIRDGELVFPPALAKVVLEEFRRMGAGGRSAKSRPDRR